ncbi:MAG: serine hydrolase [Bacteroidota bacterium]
MKRIGQVLLLLLLLAAAFVALNFTKIKRIATYPFETEITQEEWYTPLSVVDGNPVGWMEPKETANIPGHILEELAQYAGEHQSSALLILHNGQLVLEKYWEGTTRESTTNSMSMAKTIVGILIGAAIDDGLIGSEKDPAFQYLPEWANDDRKNITIEDLLYMQSGLLNDDNSNNLFSDVVNLYMGPNVEKTALNIPAEIAPATAYDYNNANTQLLGIIIERVTGKSIEDYAAQKLWQPIGAHDAGWWLDRKAGMPKAFCCFFATAQDWARLGQLFLQKGQWNGQTIISESWLKKMTTQSSLERDYGLQMWLMYEDGGYRAKGRTEPFSKATWAIDGKGKQHVFIVPELELVVVRLGEQPKEWDESIFVNSIDRNMTSGDTLQVAF